MFKIHFLAKKKGKKGIKMGHGGEQLSKFSYTFTQIVGIFVYSHTHWDLNVPHAFIKQSKPNMPQH